MTIQIPRFIKWAGGKQKLIEQFKTFFPKKINRYFEPFLGGGAVAFYIIQKFKPKEVLLTDINEELINAFNIIKKDVDKLIIALKKHKEYHTADAKKYYYKIRSVDPTDLTDLENAARFIYLNRTCFNGLYRVNSKGQFNVPIGSYKNPNIAQKDKLRKISKILKNKKIKRMSFDKIMNLTKKGDFIYFDPPYYPLEGKKSFTTYTKGNFLEEEQKLLADVFKKLNKKGCLCMLSNSDTKFIKNLYKDFKIHFVKAKRLINSDASKRGEIKEIVVTNY